MKKVVMLMIFVFFMSSVSALSSTMEEIYRPRETIIAQLSQDVIGNINAEQINLLREGYIDVGFEYGVQKINGKHYFWLIAPENLASYTLRIEDVVASVNGVPEVVDFEQDFSVEGEAVDYSVRPGVISTNKDFQVSVELFDDFSQTVQTSFPEERNIDLLPGVNTVSYDVDEVFGNQLMDITLGDYTLKAYISRPENICGDGIISGDEVCEEDDLLGVTCESLNASYVGGNLSCSDDCLEFDDSQCEVEEEEINDSVIEICGEGYWELCEIEEDCLDFDGYWYDDSCHEFEEGVSCDQNHRELCENPEECIEAEGYWYDDICNSEPEVIVGEPEFAFVPEEMNLTIFVGGQLPSYTFIIKNNGSVPI
jgi:hypothetical protein